MLSFQITDLKFTDAVQTNAERDVELKFHHHTDDEHAFPPTKPQKTGKAILSGRTMDGCSVLVVVTGFRPWIRVNYTDFESLDQRPPKPAKPASEEAQCMGMIADCYGLRHQPWDDSRPAYNARFHPTFEVEHLKSLYGWQGDPETNGATTRRFPFWKLHFATGYLRHAAAKKIGQFAYRTTNSAGHPVQRLKYSVYENDIGCETQFLVTAGLRYFGWVDVPENLAVHGRRVQGSGGGCGAPYLSWCADYEIECSIGDLTPRNDLENQMAPLCVVSWDGEMYSHYALNPDPTGAHGAFPTPDVPENAVMNIGNVVHRIGRPESENCAVIFCLGSVSPESMKVPDTDQDVDVRCFDSERDMLLAWHKFVTQEIDADVSVHFNGRLFDWPFLLKRAELCGIAGSFNRLSKLKQDYCKLEMKTFSSRQAGDRQQANWVNLFGRFDFDMLTYFKVTYKLRSYTLNAISSELLEDQKIDLSPMQMFKNFSSPEGRYETAKYCVKDCVLPLKLMSKTVSLIGHIEESRLMFTSLDSLHTKGQLLRVRNQLAYYTRVKEYAMTTAWSKTKKDFEEQQQQYDTGAALDNNNSSEDEGYQGATVIEPSAGFYVEPVVTLDFSSLYPSIMMAHNLCMSTIVRDPSQLRHSAAEFEAHQIPGKSVPTYFSQKERGVFPVILKEILSARSAVKKQMAAEKDPFRKSALNARQLALKVSANSVYGFTGCPGLNQYACIDIGATVTFRGRCMIEATKTYCEQNYTADRVYEIAASEKNTVAAALMPDELRGTRAEVIYGDTDSVMIRMPTTTDDVGKDISVLAGPVMAAEVTKALFKNPICLTFEKVYWPYLLIRKKRYIGCKYEELKRPVIDRKGVENVRRDSFLFTSELMTKVQDIIFMQKDFELAKSYIKEQLERFASKQVPFSYFVMSTNFKSASAYADPDKMLAHKVVNDIRARNPGSEPKPGERVQFVLVRVPNKKNLKLIDQAQDAAYALENNLELDLLVYLRYIQTPIESFYSVFDPNIHCELKNLEKRIKADMYKCRGFSDDVLTTSSLSSGSAAATSTSSNNNLFVMQTVRMQVKGKKAPKAIASGDLSEFCMSSGTKRPAEEPSAPAPSTSSKRKPIKRAKKQPQQPPARGGLDAFCTSSAPMTSFSKSEGAQ